jgi:O-antigen/teichoic acid export membrane protein
MGEGQLMSRFRAPSALRGVLTLSLGTIIGHCVIAASSPILTRLYGPAEFGTLAVFTSVLSLLLVPSGLRYDIAVMLPKEDAEAASLLVIAIAAVFFTGVSASVVISILHFANAGSVSIGLKGLAWLLPLSVMGGGCYQALSYWALRHRRYSQLAITKATQSTGMAATQLVTGFLRCGGLGLAMGDSVGRMVGTISLARFAWSSGKHEFRTLTLRSALQTAKRYASFPLLSCPSAFLNVAGSQIPVLLFAALYGKQVAGYYMLLDRTLAAPSALILQSISQVYSAELSRTLLSSPADSYRLFLRYAKNMCVPGILYGLCLALLGPLLFGFVFGDPWRESGFYARSFAIVQGIGVMVWPMMLTLSIMEKQRFQFVWDAARGLLTVGAVLISARLHVSARGAVFAYAVALSAAYIAYFVLVRKCFVELLEKNGHGLPLPRVVSSGA